MALQLQVGDNDPWYHGRFSEAARSPTRALESAVGVLEPAERDSEAAAQKEIYIFHIFFMFEFLDISLHLYK